MALVGRHLPTDAIVTVDAGTFGAPVYRVIPFAPPQRLLAPIAGAMGFGIPAAVAAALREPGRPVIAFVGDGGFLMTGNELAVAMERRLPLKVIVSENRSYASIWIQQEREYPGRPVATTFTNPDLAMIGAAYGFEVTHILARDELAALPAILARPGPQFVIVETSLDAVRPRAVMRYLPLLHTLSSPGLTGQSSNRRVLDGAKSQTHRWHRGYWIARSSRAMTVVVWCRMAWQGGVTTGRRKSSGRRCARDSGRSGISPPGRRAAANGCAGRAARREAR